MLEDDIMLFTEEHANRFVIEEVDKIIREKWRKIERTTRYGWLAACSRDFSMSHEDAKILSALASKIGYDNCKVAFRKIRNACRDLHPINVPRIAMAILDETYTAVIFKSKRESKWENTTLRDLPPTVFTISKDIFSKRYTILVP